MTLLGGGMDFRNASYDDWRFGDTDAVSWQKPLMQYADDRDIITSINSFLPNTTASRRDIFKYADKTLTLCNRSTDDN